MKHFSTVFYSCQIREKVRRTDAFTAKNFFWSTRYCFMIFILTLAGPKVIAQTTNPTDYFRSITTGNWNSPNTWESSPVADFSSGVVSPATISPDNNAATITIINGNTVTVAGPVTTDETIVQFGATLVENSDLTVSDGAGTDLDVNGIFNLAGTIDGAGLASINSGATFTWSGGQMGGSGTTSILSGATAQVTGGVYMFGSRTLNNASSSFALSGGNIALSSAADVINNTGIILLQGDYGFLWNGGGTINNSGTITKTNGNGISYLYNNPTGTSFNNTGIVNVNIGSIEINAGGTHTGTFNVTSNLVFKSGTQVLSSTASVIGTGSIFNAASLTLDAGCTYAATVSFNQNSGTVDWNISSGTVNAFTLSGGGLQGSGVLNIANTFTGSGGQMGGSGTTSILSGATAQVTGGVYMFGSHTLNNASSSFALSGGSIALSSSADVINNTGTMLLQGDYGFFWNGGGTINNSGKITKTNGNGISYLFNNLYGTSFNNTGIVNVNIGTIEINASGTHTGSFNVAANLVFKSGTQVLSSTSSISGTGSILNGASLTLDAGCTYAPTVSFNQNSGTVDWNISSGTVNAFTLSGGGIQGSGVLNIANTFTGTGGQMGGTGTTSILSGANAQVTGGVFMFGSRTLNNASNSFALSGGSIALSSPTDVINNTGTMLLQGDYGFLWNGGGTINNNGKITKTNGSGISYIYNNLYGTSFNNTGIVNVNIGTIEINANGTNAGSYTIASGTTLTGNFPSPFTGSSITNNGNITLIALTFNGASIQTLNGTGNINNLTIDNANGVTLGGNQTINNALTLTNGVVSTGVNKLIAGSAATIARTNGWVNSNLELPFSNSQLSKTFFIGDAINYSPILLSFNSISGSGSVLGSQTIGVHPNLGSSTISGSKRVNRYYSLTPSGFTFDNYDATFNFIASDVLNSANTANFIVGKFNPSTWTYPTVGTKTTTSTQITGVTSFSDFQIGEPCLAPSISGQPLTTQTICQNTIPANLSVTATGDGLTYQWFADNNSTGFDGSSIAGATNSSFAPPGGTAGTLFYYVVIIGDCGNATSNYTSVTVNPLFTWYRDADLDGFGAQNNPTTTCSSTPPAGYVANSSDCDDTKAAVNPGAAEICGNGIDDNCNGLIDENCTACSNATDTSTSNITSSSATLNWKAKANPAQWQVQYKTTKLGSMWVDVFVTGDKRSITLLNLAANQNYKWNIRAKCGSKWLSYTGSISFTTLARTVASRSVTLTKEKTFGFIIYPNPTNGNFKIAVKGLENKLTSTVLVEIENGYGQLVYSKRVENINGIIDVTMDRKVAAGIYLVHCIVNGENVTKKIVIGKEL